MKILLSWLQEFVPLSKEPRKLAEALTMLGLPVDSVAEENGEVVVDLDITTNRPDCLSHYGVARELAAFYGQPLAPFGVVGKEKPHSRLQDSIVEIRAPDLCSRYSARLIREVKVAPSPTWLARRVELVGIRSINNVADATNYILMGYGHPLHAFDLDRLEGGKIIVRRAEEGEMLTTLDGVERQLCSQDLVIADARRAVALAGVMGGLDTEISPRTRNVLLESAWFDPVAVRRTSKRQGLHTEASHRFERGADLEATLAAANRCIELIRELTGGIVEPREIDAYAGEESREPIRLRRSELVRHLGLEIPLSEVENILTRLGFSPQAQGAAEWVCTAPTHRVDVSREIDLIEEVARHYGYDRFPLRLPAIVGQAARQAVHAAKEQRVRALLLALGYDETLSSILVSRDAGAFTDSEPVALANPLSEEASVLRTSMVPSLLAAVQWNLNRGQETARLFEIGNVYRRDGNRYREPPVLALAATGDRVESSLTQPGKKLDFYDLKGDLEQLAELFAVSSCSFDSQDLPDYYRPGRRARLVVEETTAGRLGELHPDVAEKWKFRRPVFVAELFLESLYRKPLRPPRVEPLSRYPAVERDFSVLLPKHTRFEAVREAILALRIPELVAVAPLEVFEGAPVPPGCYSLLLRVTLQSRQATLTEAELADYSARIIECLERRLGAQIRM